MTAAPLSPAFTMATAACMRALVVAAVVCAAVGWAGCAPAPSQASGTQVGGGLESHHEQQACESTAHALSEAHLARALTDVTDAQVAPPLDGSAHARHPPVPGTARPGCPGAADGSDTRQAACAPPIKRADPVGIRHLVRAVHGDVLWPQPHRPAAHAALLAAAHGYVTGGRQCSALPAVLVLPRTVGDVAAAVVWARRAGLPLAVRGGGHSYTCQSTRAGSVTISLGGHMRGARLADAADLGQRLAASKAGNVPCSDARSWRTHAACLWRAWSGTGHTTPAPHSPGGGSLGKLASRLARSPLLAAWWTPTAPPVTPSGERGAATPWPTAAARPAEVLGHAGSEGTSRAPAQLRLSRQHLLADLAATSLSTTGVAVHVQGGARLFEVMDAVPRDRYTMIHGTCSTVGYGGFSLSGGFHLWALTPVHGTAAQHLLAARGVLANGTMFAVSRHGTTTVDPATGAVAVTADTSLLYALRGGGGSFAIVTDFLVRVHRRREQQPARLLVEVDGPDHFAELVARSTRLMPDYAVSWLVHRAPVEPALPWPLGPMLRAALRVFLPANKQVAMAHVACVRRAGAGCGPPSMPRSTSATGDRAGQDLTLAGASEVLRSVGISPLSVLHPGYIAMAWVCPDMVWDYHTPTQSPLGRAIVSFDHDQLQSASVGVPLDTNTSATSTAGRLARAAYAVVSDAPAACQQCLAVVSPIPAWSMRQPAWQDGPRVSNALQDIFDVGAGPSGGGIVNVDATCM